MSMIRTERATYRPTTVRGCHARKLYRTLWVSTDGRKQKICDMNSQHIRNCLNLMDGLMKTFRLSESYKGRIVTISCTEAWPPYECMERELVRRGEER